MKEGTLYPCSNPENFPIGEMSQENLKHLSRVQATVHYVTGQQQVVLK
jgi:hypothetical protein